MGRARNQRSKAEGSFLESVRDALQRLQEDLCYIKSTVVELKHAPEAYQHGVQHIINVGEFPATGWDDWNVWNSLGFPDDGTVNVGQYDAFWNTNVATFVPATTTNNDVLSKASLLSFRAPLSQDVPDDMVGLSTRRIGDDSPPCEGSSLCGGSVQNSDDELDYDHGCEICGIPFIQPPGEYDGDRCDVCASPGHRHCLIEFVDLRGVWLLCSSCREKRLASSFCVQGEFRTIPDTFWKKLYMMFDSGTKAGSADVENSVVHLSQPGEGDLNRQEVQWVVEQRRVLESRLDYMVRYLEMGKGKISETVWRDILHEVKKSQAWMKRSLGSAEVRQKISDLDQFMKEALEKRNQPSSNAG